MIKRLLIMATVVTLAAVTLAAAYVLRPSAEASEPIQAISLTAASPPDSSGTTGSAVTVFEIDSTASQVSFELDEDLRGVRTTVVGVTDQVAGQIVVDPLDLKSIQVGTIQVNARTLVTDNGFRNRAIQNEILDTGGYEYITFTPTAINGLPGSIDIGATVSFTIVGDLTIRNVTQPVTFDVTATLNSATELSASASATVLRGDYGLTIPNVPQVANVADAVQLTIQFVANA